MPTADFPFNNMGTRAGKWVKQMAGPEDFACFVPAALPPNPPIQYDMELHDLQDRANRALGRLEGISLILPDPNLFLYSYVRKEAVLSSQIEGTQSSLSDLLLFETLYMFYFFKGSKLNLLCFLRYQTVVIFGPINGMQNMISYD